MRRTAILSVLVPAVLAFGLSPGVSLAANPPSNHADARVNVGSPRTHFPRNKQNEPAVGVTLNPTDPSVLAAGSNDEIDNAPCKGNACGFTPGVTDNGIYFSFNRGASWVQPTYSGYSARTGTPKVGPTGTVPWFYEGGLVGDGDPALAFGPAPGPNGFSWSNGSRLYYSSLTSNFPGSTRINALEAIAVSHTDNVRAAAAGDKNAWSRPVIASRELNPAIFSDKEEIWADNAASSPHFGNTYICWGSFGATESRLLFARSTDGGTSWSDPVALVTASNSSVNSGFTACTIRTDSHGTVYMSWMLENTTPGAPSFMKMVRSFDGGLSFDRNRRVATVHDVGNLDPVHVANGDPRLTFDGIAGARTFSSLQVDIANGAPTGRDATDQIVMTWSDARNGLNHEQALVQTSRDRGTTFTDLEGAQQAGDRPDLPAIAISPDGRTAYLAYDAFLAPWQTTTSTPRPMQGVVRAAAVDAAGRIGTWKTLHRGAVGDARGSSENNLCCEFLGDYNYASASRTFGAAVWNDVRGAADCPAVDAWRQSLLTATPLPKPAPATACPPTFGNSDIFGGTYTLVPSDDRAAARA